MKDIHESIYETHNSVKQIEGDTKENIKAFDINGDEVVIDMDAVNAKATELQTAHDNEVQAKEDLKASAKEKLIAGEPLTEEEADTIVL